MKPTRTETAGPRDGLSTLLVAVVVFAVSGVAACLEYRPLTYLVGDGPYYAETAVSLLYDHDLDLRNQLAGGLEVHGPQIALGPGGQWYPKHPILLAVLGLPFLAALGMPGLLVMNLGVLAALAAAMFRLGRRFAPAPWAVLAVAVLLCGTFVRAYAYNLSPDLLAGLLATEAVIALLGGRTAGAGLLFGAAVLSKPLLVVLVPPALLFAAARARMRGVARMALGAAAPAAAFLLINLSLFGSPFVTAYDRNVRMTAGVAQVTSHRAMFDQDPLAGAAGQVLDRRHGLLWTAPVLLLAIPGGILRARRRRAEALWLGASAAALFLALCVYRDWSRSHYGNRFLIPVVALATPAVALALENAGHAVARRRPARRPLAGTEAGAS